MASRIIDNNAYELSITPSRKRKRESGNLDASINAETAAAAPIAACFTNAAFSSTPKKLLAKRLLHKENLNPFLTNPCFEVKSIIDIVKEQQQQKTVQDKSESKSAVQHAPDNPYEVVRKPPKKKKKRTDIEVACFENPALNLELPEKQFNPFEVHREPVPTNVPTSASKCFINEALNLRIQDVPASRNPFEIPRCSAVSVSAANPAGVENFALEAGMQPSNLQIGLPFTPTVGCRIDFKNLPLSQLTPSKLFAEKLVFSPVFKTPKRSLSSISEETMDIGKELDRYQLELENSINEAKLRKGAGGLLLDEEVLLEVEQKITFSQKLTGILEQDEETLESNAEHLKITKTADDDPVLENTPPTSKNFTAAAMDSVPLLTASEEMADDAPPNDGELTDVAYASAEEDELDDFKAPAPFIRAYRRAEPITSLTVSKESLNSVKSDESDASERKKSHNVKSMLRNSIRKLIHPLANEKDKVSATVAPEKNNSAPSSIMSSIRHSLRRKPQRQTLCEEELHTFPPIKPAEISIIDSSERTMKLKSNFMQTDSVKIEDFTHEKKHSLRSSLRKSTREVRQQFMKAVFHKNQEEYAFGK